MHTFLVGDYPGNDYLITTKFSYFPFFKRASLQPLDIIGQQNIQMLSAINVSAKIQTLKTRAAFLVTNQILVIYLTVRFLR